jgi:protein TonB
MASAGHCASMNARRNRVLTWALALSLAAHAVLLYFAQSLKYTEAAPAPLPPTTIKIIAMVPPTAPPPTPTPKPEVVPPEPAQQTHSIAVVPPVLPLQRNSQVGPPEGPPALPVGIGPPGPDVLPDSEPPIPTIAPGPSCSDDNMVARAVNPVVPEEPAVAQEEGLSGTTLVKVDLDAAGAVTGVSIYRSSGSSVLDAAAEAAARQTNYKPELRDCEPVAGAYIFAANFQ